MLGVVGRNEGENRLMSTRARRYMEARSGSAFDQRTNFAN